MKTYQAIESVVLPSYNTVSFPPQQTQPGLAQDPPPPFTSCRTLVTLLLGFVLGVALNAAFSPPSQPPLPPQLRTVSPLVAKITLLESLLYNASSDRSPHAAPPRSDLPPFSYAAASLQYNISSLTYCLTRSSSPSELSSIPPSHTGSLTVTEVIESSTLTDVHALVGYFPDGDLQLAFKGSKTPANFALDFEVQVRFCCLEGGPQNCLMSTATADDNRRANKSFSPPISSLASNCSSVQLISLLLGSPSSSFPGCPGCLVHAGFHKGLSAVLSSVKSALSVAASLAPPSSSRTLRVTGHSLGGALASLAAFSLSSPSPSSSLFASAEVVTFGEPRVGNPSFAAAYDRTVPKTWRVVNQGDTVPHTPITDFGYCHEGVEVWFPHKGTTERVQCTTEAESDAFCSNTLVGLATLVTPWSPIDEMTTKLAKKDHNTGWIFGADINRCPI